MKRLASAALLLALCGRALALEPVVFPGADVDSTGAPVSLRGWHAAPGGAGPFPAVVLLHGCSGATTRGAVNERFAEAAARAVAAGYEVLLVDSFGSRGLREVCTVPFGERSVTQRHRRADAFAALEWLAARPTVRAERIALMGWSHGGSTVLAVLAQNDARARRYAAAIAFYPGCAPALRAGAAFAPRTPFAILIGEADDWTPEPPCRELATALQAAGASVEYRAYPGAHHGFDGTAQLRVRKVPNTASGTATVGGHPEARVAALAEVDALLARWLRP